MRRPTTLWIRIDLEGKEAATDGYRILNRFLDEGILQESIDGPDLNVVQVVSATDPDSLNDGSAPTHEELVAALEAMLCRHSKCDCGIEQARAAVAKATGQTPKQAFDGAVGRGG